MFGWILAAASCALVAALIRYWRLDRFVLGLVSLLDLLLTVKRRARAVQTKNPEWTMADTIEESCSKFWDNTFVIVAGHDDDERASAPSSAASAPTSKSRSKGRARMTYGEAEMASSAVAKWLTAPGSSSGAVVCQPNDIVAIFMPSGCEFVVSLFGLIRCGVRAALVNTGLRGNALAHALTTALDEGQEGSSSSRSSSSRVRAVLVSPDLKPLLESLQEGGQLPSSIDIVECGPGCELDPWTETKRFAYLGRQHQKQQQQKEEEQQQQPSSRWDETCLYIYTSGTTGLPKASKMNHMRIWSAGCVGKKLCRLRPSDRLYCPLPLHHTSGLAIGLGACLQMGCSTVIRPKFSVRHFSRDLLAHECTGAQYIGEMARYLTSASANKLDSKAKLRFALGNGMPPEIWIPFRNRYNIDLVIEFYGSTEGNVNMVNGTGMAPGACGIVPPGFGWIYPIGIFKYDTDTGELLRDLKTGLCVPAGPNEPGELLGLIKQDDPSRRFDGYTNDTATKSKIVDNVCKTGDRYFRSGDLLRQDRCGFLYFCDRVGETFRWKGENVSTSEVARAVLDCSEKGGDTGSFAEAVVYGVEVEGHPGRAGMATVVLTEGGADEPWQDSLWHSLQSELPRYAQPLFIRIKTQIEKTSTQKYKKTKLQDESFWNCGSDPIYFRDDAAKTFVLVDATVKEEIASGKRRV